MFAYITSCTPFRRSDARIAWMRRNSTAAVGAVRRVRLRLRLVFVRGDVHRALPLLVRVEFLGHAVQRRLDRGREQVRLVVQHVRQHLAVRAPGIHRRARERGGGERSSAASPAAARATEREARRRRAKVARPEDTRRGASPGLEGGVDAAKDARAATRR